MSQYEPIDFVVDDELIEPVRQIIHRCTNRQLHLLIMAISQLLIVRERESHLARGRKVSETRRLARESH